MRNLPIEFVVIGYTQEDLALFKTGRVFVTGRYEEEEALDLICDQVCDFAFLPSVSPETWSYSLTLAWKAGLSVLAFDIGAISERIREKGHGYVMPFTSDEKVINLALSNLGHFGSLGLDEPQGASIVDVAGSAQGSRLLVATIQISRAADLAISETSLSLDPGIYSFSVKASVEPDGAGRVAMPAIQILPAAGQKSGAAVEFLGSRKPVENWLIEIGDVVIVRVSGAARGLLVKSLRLSGNDTAAVLVDCHRLGRSDKAGRLDVAGGSRRLLRAQITAHIQNRGDLPFITPGWAGCTGQNLWIEAFSINPLEGVSPDEIEYKALTDTGYETPWISGGNLCGTRGASNPLVAFAIRLRGAAAQKYDCEYRGEFNKAGVVGPLRNGAGCKSAQSNDPLLGIYLELFERIEADFVTSESLLAFVPQEYEVVSGSN